MAELWFDKINRNTDWGGDASTNNLPVAGSAVQDFIKSELNSKIGVVFHDELSARYLCFAHEEDKLEYLSDRTKEYLILGSFEAPSDYKAKILVDSYYNAVLINSTNNSLTFGYKITNNDEEFVDNVRYTVTITKNGKSSEFNGIGIYGQTVTINMDEYMTIEGTTEVTIQITGQLSNATALSVITYEVVNLVFESSHNVSEVYDENNPLIINYSIFGTNNIKYIEWYLDGKYLETDSIQGGTAEPIDDNKRISVSDLEYGVHNIQFRAYVTVNGENFYTDTLYKELLVNTSAQSKSSMIAIESVIPKEIGIISTPYLYGATQYEAFTIHYGVYNPEHLESIPVSIYFDNVLLNTVNAPNNYELSYSITSNSSGQKSLTFVSGDYQRTIAVQVASTDMNLQENTANLTLALSASGRTNEDINKDEWIYNDYETTFTGFTWNNLSGWNDNRLVISKDMSITNTIKPLLNTANGKTLEFEFETFNVTNDDAIICDLRNNDNIGLCITASKAVLTTGYGSTENVATNYKANENVRISFVIDSLKKLALIYVNGIVSGAIALTSNLQIDKELSFVGNEDAGIKLKQIRIYDTQLSSEQILNNYILYRDNISEIQDLYKKNDILDGGVISPDKVSNFIPVILLTGEQIFELETKKDTSEEIKIDVEYINKQDPTHQFKFYGGCCRIQGTSSAGYVRKNWRIYSKRKKKFIADVYDWQGNKVTDENRRIAFKEGAVPVNCWTLKADFAESSGTHNVGVATLWNDVMYNAVKAGGPNNGYVCRTNSQIAALENNYEYDCRTTVDGFPIVVFARRNDSENYTFMGKYNFNNDKSTENVFGFCDIPGFDDQRIADKPEVIPNGEFNAGKKYTYGNKMQCWEIRDSEDKYALFKTTENWYVIQKDENGNDRVDEDGIPIKNWATGFEARYPDDGNEADTADLKAFIDWLVSCDAEKFEKEKNNHLDLWKIAAYYVYLYRFGAVDQVAKNAMLTSEDGHHWYFINYDNDTILGLDNSGILAYPPTINRDTKSGATYAYAGRESKLWNLLEDNADFMNYYVPEIDNALYSGGLTYENTLKYFNVNQCDKWCETIYNKDAEYKYIQPYTSGKVNELAKMHGNRKSHRTWWLSKRFQLMDAKFNNFNATSKYIHLKLDGADFAEFSIKSSDPMYYSAVINTSPWYTGVYLDTEESKTFTINRPFNQGTPIYIYSPLYIEELDLSVMSKYIYLLEFGTLVDPVTTARMKKLIIGSNNVSAKTLQALSGLNVLTNLEYLDVTGIDYPTLDISNLTLLKTLILTKSKINSLSLPKGCMIEDLYLNDNLSSLECSDLYHLHLNNVYGFTNHHIKHVSIKNCPYLLDNFGAFYDWVQDAKSGDSLTLEGINWNDIAPEALITFKRLKDLGVQYSLKGVISITAPTLEQVYELQDIFGENCFTNNGELWISAPDSIFIQGPAEIRSDTPNLYKTIIFSKYPGSVAWSIVEGSEFIEKIEVNDDYSAIIYPIESVDADHKISIKAAHTPSNSADSYVVPTTFDIISKKINYATNGTITGNTTIQNDETLYLDLGNDPYLGKFTTTWEVIGESVDNNSISLINATNTQITVQYIKTVIFDKCTLIAHILNNDGSTFDVTASIIITDETVLMTSNSNPEVMYICYKHKLCASPDVMYKAEARSCTNQEFGTIFKESNIKTFDEFEYFTGLTSIAGMAFYTCRSLKSIKLPNNIQNIGNLAFGFTSLSSIDIPTSVVSISHNAFINTQSLKEINVSASNIKYKSIDSALVTQDNMLVKFPEAKEIDEYEINPSIISLGPQSISNTQIKKLWTNNVIDHADSAISNNKKLTELYVGASFNPNNFAQNINTNEKLHTIIVDADHGTLISENGVVYDRSKKLLVKYPENKGNFSILPVETIGPRAFWNCANLNSIILPDTVKDIKHHAFYFAKVNSIIFNASSVLETIESFGIAHTEATSIVFPKSLKSLDSQSMQGNAKLYLLHFKGEAPLLTDVVEIDGIRTITTVFGLPEQLTGDKTQTKILYVPANSTGYDHEDWTNSILSPTRNNFTLSKTL